MMQSIIKRIYQALPFRLSSNDRITSRPLLGDNEILDLLLRVQNKNKSVSHKQDIAHRQIGDIRSIYRGYGMDYEESRHYQTGDDPRYMNWQLTARTGQLYMKVFREERQPGVFILMDRRPSMRFGTRVRLKVTQAARVATLAAFTAQANNLTTDGVILDEELTWFKDNHKKQAIFDFIHHAVKPVPPVFNINHATQKSMNEVLALLNEILITGSKIYLISDFQDINESSQAVLLQLASKHQVHAIKITDPAEIRLPRAGEIHFMSADLNALTLVDTDSLAEREKYDSEANKYFVTRKKYFENCAISYQEILSSSDPLEQQVVF